MAASGETRPNTIITATSATVAEADAARGRRRPGAHGGAAYSRDGRTDRGDEPDWTSTDGERADARTRRVRPRCRPAPTPLAANSRSSHGSIGPPRCASSTRYAASVTSDTRRSTSRLAPVVQLAVEPAPLNPAARLDRAEARTRSAAGVGRQRGGQCCQHAIGAGRLVPAHESCTRPGSARTTSLRSRCGPRMTRVYRVPATSSGPVASLTPEASIQSATRAGSVNAR